MKKSAVLLTLIAVAALALGASATACDRPCAAMKAGDKGCAHGDPHMAAVQKAFVSLEADLTAMQKGIPDADRAAFMKSHQDNLKALFDARSACMKNCKTDAAKTDMKGCKHQQAQQANFESLEGDLARMEKGVPAADQTAFMKAHEEHLKSLIDTHDACMKECKGKGAAKTDKT